MTVLVPGRLATAEEIPSAAMKRIKKAERLGWETYRCTYAKAEIEGRKGPTTMESIALGFRKGSQRVVITYENGGFRSSWHINDKGPSLTWVKGSREIDSILEGST